MIHELIQLGIDQKRAQISRLPKEEATKAERSLNGEIDLQMACERERIDLLSKLIEYAVKGGCCEELDEDFVAGSVRMIEHAGQLHETLLEKLSYKLNHLRG